MLISLPSNSNTHLGSSLFSEARSLNIVSFKPVISSEAAAKLVGALITRTIIPFREMLLTSDNGPASHPGIGRHQPPILFVPGSTNGLTWGVRSPC